MTISGLQAEAFQPQTPYLASPAIALLLSPTFPQPSSLLSFSQKVNSGLSASSLDAPP